MSQRSALPDAPRAEREAAPTGPADRARSGRAAAGVAAWYALVFIPLFLFAAWFVGQERTVYYWDYSNYHTKYQDLGDLARSNPVRALREVVASVRHADYNYLPVLPLMPVRLFSDGRQSFVLAVSVLYAVPAVLLFSLLMRRLAARLPGAPSGNEPGIVVLSAVPLALLPQFWGPVLRGFPDVVGIAVIFAVLAIFTRRRLDAQPAVSLIAMGLLLCGLVLLRRWYAYWVVGFFVGAGVQILWDWLRAPAAERRAALRAASHLAAIGVTALIPLFGLATPIAMRMLLTDYASALAAYDAPESALEQAKRLLGYFGIFTLAAAAAGLVIGLRRPEWRRLAGLLGMQMVVSYALFRRVQVMGGHHAYLLVGGLAVFAAMALLALYIRGGTRLRRGAVVLVTLVALVTQFRVVLDPRAGPALQAAGFLFGEARTHPLRRSDLGELQRMLAVLDSLTTPTGAGIYVLASSGTFNNSVLRNAARSLGGGHAALEDRVLNASHVDAYDGFPVYLPAAEYVLVQDPVGYHLPPDAQRVIGIPAAAVLHGTGIGAAFRRTPHVFHLEHGTTVRLFHRVRPIGRNALAGLADTLASLYPGKRERFALTSEQLERLAGTRN